MKFLCTVLLACVGLLSSSEALAERGYAVWHAASAKPVGTEVTVKDGQFIDRAFLRPADAIRTLAPLYDTDKQRVILPAGASLALMSGGRAGEYCTWNHGSSLVSDSRRAGLLLTDRGGVLCLSVGPDQTTERLHYISATNPLILREYSMDFARGAKHFNSVSVQKISPDEYPGDVEVGPVALLQKGRPCMRWGMAVTGGLIDVFSAAVACFDDVGTTITVQSGRYELLAWDAKAKQMSIRIERGFVLDGFDSRIDNGGY